MYLLRGTIDKTPTAQKFENSQLLIFLKAMEEKMMETPEPKLSFMLFQENRKKQNTIEEVSKFQPSASFFHVGVRLRE